MVGDNRAEQCDPVDLLGALDMSRGDVGGIDHVLGRSQGGLGQVVVNLPGELAVLDRGDRGGDVHHDLGRLFLAGLGVVHAIAAPLGAVLGAVVRVGVVGRVEAQARRWQRVPVAPTELSFLVPVVVVDPQLPQDFNLGKCPQPARCAAGPQSGQHFLPIPSEDLRPRDHGLRPTGSRSCTSRCAPGLLVLSSRSCTTAV